MKTLQKYLTVILLFSMFNVFGQVQQDGSITFQKLCEDCDTPGDEDGDGFEDCNDLDCLLRNINNLKPNAPQKSNDECPINDLNSEEIDILLELKNEFLELGMSAEEAMMAARFEYWQRQGLLFPEPQECEKGNDIFDINGDFVRRDESDMFSEILINVDEELIRATNVNLSTEAMETIATYYLNKYFPNATNAFNINFRARNLESNMEIGNTSSDRNCTNSKPGDLRNILCCTDDIGIMIGYQGLSSMSGKLTGQFFYNRNAFLSTLSHELNHLLTQFNLNNGCANFNDGMLAMQHVIIYSNQISGGFFECAKNEIEVYESHFQASLETRFLRFLELTNSDEYRRIHK